MPSLSSINVTEDVFAVSMMLEAGMPMVIFDIETTGRRSDRDRILSFSAIKVQLENDLPKIIDTMNTFINPGCKIPASATEVNGITNEDVKDAPSEKEAIKDIKMFFGPRPLIAGYNSKNFDEKFIKKAYKRLLKEDFTPYFHLDIFQMAKQKLDISGYTLQEVAHELGADSGIKFHNAEDDVIATFRCFNILRMEYICEDEQEEEKEKVTVIKARIWEGPNPKLKRIYIETKPYIEGKIYYDIYYKSWKAQENIDLEDVREQVLAMNDCKDEKELEKFLREENS